MSNNFSLITSTHFITISFVIKAFQLFLYLIYNLSVKNTHIFFFYSLVCPRTIPLSLSLFFTLIIFFFSLSSTHIPFDVTAALTVQAIMDQLAWLYRANLLSISKIFRSINSTDILHLSFIHLFYLFPILNI